MLVHFCRISFYNGRLELGIQEAISFVADSKAILGGVGDLTLISAAGAMPKVGFLRALMLGGKSYFKTTTPLSVRRSEIQQLNASILSMQRGSYITVVGGKGNGKTCLIDTALNRHCGVVKFSVRCFILYCLCHC